MREQSPPSSIYHRDKSIPCHSQRMVPYSYDSLTPFSLSSSPLRHVPLSALLLSSLLNPLPRLRRQHLRHLTLIHLQFLQRQNALPPSINTLEKKRRRPAVERLDQSRIGPFRFLSHRFQTYPLRDFRQRIVRNRNIQKIRNSTNFTRQVASQVMEMHKQNILQMAIRPP